MRLCTVNHLPDYKRRLPRHKFMASRRKRKEASEVEDFLTVPEALRRCPKYSATSSASSLHFHYCVSYAGSLCQYFYQVSTEDSETAIHQRNGKINNIEDTKTRPTKRYPGSCDMIAFEERKETNPGAGKAYTGRESKCYSRRLTPVTLSIPNRFIPERSCDSCLPWRNRLIYAV